MKKLKDFFNSIVSKLDKPIPFNVYEPLSNPIEDQYLWIVNTDCNGNKFANDVELNKYLYRFTGIYLSRLYPNNDIVANASVNISFEFKESTMYIFIHAESVGLYQFPISDRVDFKECNILTFKRFLFDLKTNIGCLNLESQGYRK